MAATFLLKLGTLDLSSYCRMNPEDKFDPYGAPWLTPAFAETPFADQQALISVTAGNREMLIPLFLKEPSKDLLHALVQKINNAGGQRPLQVEWRDDSATKSTFYDVVFMRFEPDFNFRRSIHGYAAGVMHFWVAGYAHSGTVRIAGTATIQGAFLSVPIPSIGGDAPALMDTTISAGAVVPSLGRIVGLAPINHPSYTALIPAASLTERQAGATLVNQSGAQGSQYLALPVSPTGGASGIACKVPLGNPTIMGGDNRVLAVCLSAFNVGIGITALDPYGNVMGPTAIASNNNAMAVVDLGVCRLPTVGFPTRPEISILAGGIWASGAPGPQMGGSPAFWLNEVICLPDKNLTLVLESHGFATSYSVAGFAKGGPLDNEPDDRGNPWSDSFNLLRSGTGYLFDTGLGWMQMSAQGIASPQPNDLDSAHLAGIIADPMEITLTTSSAGASPGQVAITKERASGAYVEALLQENSPGPGGFIALRAATNTTLNLVASEAVASIPGQQLTFSLRLEGPRAAVGLTAGGLAMLVAGASSAFASVGASNAAFGGKGIPGLAIQAGGSGVTEFPKIYSWSVTSLPSSNLAAYDAYRFDGPNADVYRTASSGVFAGQKLMSVQRGTFPKAAPSTSSVAIICAPFDQGAMTDTTSAVVSVKERFFMAR